MKIYSSRTQKFDVDARIAELSPQKKDNSNEIKEACESMQNILSKKFREFDIKVSWGNKIDGYLIKIKDTKSDISCVLEPLDPNSRGLSNLNTNIVTSANTVGIEYLSFYIKRLSTVDKIYKTATELVKNYTHTNVSHELEFLKNPSIKLLMQHSSTPYIWIGNSTNTKYYQSINQYSSWSNYYRLDPNNHDYIQQAQITTTHMYINKSRIDLKSMNIIRLDERDLITTDDLRDMASEIGISKVVDRINVLGLGNLGGS